MEKLTKNIHNHTFTDLLKVLIFGLMLLLPGIMFLPSCLYYGFNEHATNTETTTINYKYESNVVETSDDLIPGNVYSFNCEDKTIYNMMNEGEYILFTLLDQLNTQDWISEVDEMFGYSAVPSQTYVCIQRNDFYHTNWISFYAQKPYDIDDFDPYLNMVYDDKFLNNVHIELINFNLIYDDLLSFISYTDYNVIESVSVNTDDTISTKLYNSWEDLWQSPLFAWTSNTPFNTSLNGFIGVFGINNQSYISNVLIWLLSITAIYVVIDIVIGVFKWLTHLIGNR